MPDNIEMTPATFIDNLPPTIQRFRADSANGAFAVADLLEAAHRILVAPTNPGVYGLRLNNADFLRLLALRMPAD